MKRFFAALAIYVLFWVAWAGHREIGMTKQAGLVAPYLILVWVSLVRDSDSKTPLIAAIFPGWSLICWVWLPVVFQSVCVVWWNGIK